MGGIGSGRSSYSTSPTVDQSRKLEVRYLSKHGLLDEASVVTLHWNMGLQDSGSAQIWCLVDVIFISFGVKQLNNTWKPFRQKVVVDRTPCHFGGFRKWFLCPGCSARVRVLSLSRSGFYCRHCLGLKYQSQRLRSAERALQQMHKLEHRIFEHYESGHGSGKRKGMHWSTYKRIASRFRQIELAWCRHVLKQCNIPIE